MLFELFMKIVRYKQVLFARIGKFDQRHRWFKWVLPFIILFAGIAAASIIIITRPRAQKIKPAEMVATVEVVPLNSSSQNVIIHAMGTVVPVRKIALQARVSGEVVEINPEFIEGGLLKKDDVIIKIDPEDYNLALVHKESLLAKAQAELKLEHGRQDIAKIEWEMLHKDINASELDQELALRKPHLETAIAGVKMGQVDVDHAKLDLERTSVRASFNAVVHEKNIDLGSQVLAQSQLATLVSTDEYWVQASIPIDRLKWIDIPSSNDHSGSSVKINSVSSNNPDFQRTGCVSRLLSSLEIEGRMARIMVLVKDPLDLETENASRPPLLLGEYVRVKIEGKELNDVFKIPRTALREDSSIWLLTEDSTLDIKKVNTIWRDKETVLIKNGLTDGELLIVSDLPAAVKGMSLAVETPDKEIDDLEVYISADVENKQETVTAKAD